MPAPAKFLEFIDENADKFIQRLANAVAIPSISGDPTHREDVFRMATFMEKQLTSLGVTTKMVDLGTETLDGHVLKLPPVVLGKIGEDPKKKTVLIYGHFDVQPAQESDGWDSDPFTLTIRTNGELVGRGSSDDKGPILGWLNVLEAHCKSVPELDLPVNIRFCFEGMEESGSIGLDEFIASEAVKQDGWFQGVDAVCISDNYWLNTRKPAVTYGLRGISYYLITVKGPSRDLHSGVFGGTVHEPMTDLIAIMSKLVTPDGRILIPGVADMVSAASEEEIALYKDLDYSIADIEQAVGAQIVISSDKTKALMSRMRLPSLSLHGIEGAFNGAGEKTVIPAKVIGKFSIRLVPPQTPDTVMQLTIPYIEAEFAKLNSKNTLTVECRHSGKPWVENINHWNYAAAIKATNAVYHQQPDLTREGGSIPVTLTFAERLGVNVLLLPMGRGDDGAHSTNEKLDRSNFIEGTKLLGTYLYEVGAIATQ